MQLHGTEIITKTWLIKITDLFRHGLPAGLKIVYIIFESITSFCLCPACFLTLHTFFLIFTMGAFTLYTCHRFGLYKRIFHSHHLFGYGIGLLFVGIPGGINRQFRLEKRCISIVI